MLSAKHQENSLFSHTAAGMEASVAQEFVDYSDGDVSDISNEDVPNTGNEDLSNHLSDVSNLLAASVTWKLIHKKEHVNTEWV